MITISKQSWHYRFMAFLGLDSRNSPTICGYLRDLLIWSPLLIGMLLSLAASLLLIAVVVPWGIGDFIGWAIAVLVQWQWIPPEKDGPWIIGAFSAFVAAGMGAFFAIRGGGTLVLSNDYPILSVAWDSVHGKICARIQVK